MLDIEVWNLSYYYYYYLIFQISLVAMVAVSPRVHCPQEPVWSWGHRGQGETRSVWKKASTETQFKLSANVHIDFYVSVKQLNLHPHSRLIWFICFNGNSEKQGCRKDALLPHHIYCLFSCFNPPVTLLSPLTLHVSSSRVTFPVVQCQQTEEGAAPPWGSVT